MKQHYLIIIIVLALIGAFVTQAQEDFPSDLLDDGSIDLVDPILLLDQQFTSEEDWELYESDSGAVGVDERDEVYIIEVESDDGPAFLWGQDYRVYGDIVIQVETEQLSRELDNGYGVMCRADPSNNAGGYYFYISGDGFATIFRREDDEVEYLFEWQTADAVNQGRESNDLTIVCVDDYLGFYVNGELIAEVEDDTFDEGVVGFSASVYPENEDVEIAYDNLLIWEVLVGERSNSGSDRNSAHNQSDNADLADFFSDDDEFDVDDLEDEIAEMLEDGDVEIELEDVMSFSTWDDDDDDGWEEFDDDDYDIEVDDEALRIQEESGDLIWSVNDEDHDDVVITTEISLRDEEEGSLFGLMCRVDEDNLSDGYSFLIGIDGSYAIGYWEDDEYTSLLGDNFESNRRIDENDTYTMTIVCVDEYLALYVDSDLIEEVEDDTFDEGFAAVIAGAFDADAIDVSFDNLVIWEAND